VESNNCMCLLVERKVLSVSTFFFFYLPKITPIFYGRKNIIKYSYKSEFGIELSIFSM